MKIAERTFRVERQVKLVFPAEFITCFAQCIVTHLCSGMPFCQVGGMGGYPVSYTHLQGAAKTGLFVPLEVVHTDYNIGIGYRLSLIHI